MKTLAAVSGGLDSVAMLYLLLTQGDAVHVHHVSLQVSTKRHVCEDAVMARIVDWLRGQGFTFEYSESVIPRGQHPGPDIVNVTRRCAQLAKQWPTPPRRFVRGQNAHNAESMGSTNNAAKALEVWKKEWGPDAPPIEFPIRHMRRPALWDMLPPELAALTWSCRRPRIGPAVAEPCGQCHACKELKEHNVPLNILPLERTA